MSSKDTKNTSTVPKNMNLDQFLNEDADDQDCSICHDGTVYVDNEIIFCEKCNVAVHQNCYGVDVIPEDDWFCDLCKGGKSPSTTPCMLCPYTGGAYKPTTMRDKWVHVICAIWVPEVFSPVIGCYDVSNVNSERFRLKCSLCKGKGASIQCSYGRCCSAAHPWCALQKGSGFTSRVVPNPFDNNNLLWEIFCKTHCNAVSEPVKPKVKAKQISNLPLENGDDKDIYKNQDKNRSTRKSNGKVSGSTETEFIPQSIVKSSEKKKDRKQRLSASKARFTSDCDSDADFEAMIESHEGAHAMQSQNDVKASSIGNGHNGPPFSLVSLNEWKGQSDGEPLGLHHFWNFVASMFPEDHSEENPNYEEYMSTIPPLGSIKSTIEKLLDGDEAIIASQYNGSQFRDIVDEDKRELFHTAVIQYIHDLGSKREIKNGKVDAHFSSCTDIGNHNSTDSCENSTLKVAAPNASTASSIKFDPINISYVTRRKLKFEGFDLSSKPQRPKGEALNVLFASNPRYCASFLLRVPSQHEAQKVSVEADGKWRSVSLEPNSEVSISEEERIQNLFKKHGVLGPKTGFQGPFPSMQVDVALGQFRRFGDSSHGRLLDKELIAFDEEDEMCELIRRDSKLFIDLVSLMAQCCRDTIQSNEFSQIHEERRKKQERRDRDKANVEKYQKQKVWGRVCRSTLLGVKDHGDDFNKPREEEVPASWTVQVAGRPKESAREMNTVNERELDAVCMCCFDGGIDDSNNILFCDGCNATMHQACYGVPEVPEGDYFCDRCLYLIQILAERRRQCMLGNFNGPGRGDVDFSNPMSIRDSVRCCLCPNYHGGLKRTTDGRWVHLCCAIWSESAVFDSVVGINRVDLSKVSENKANLPASSRSQHVATSICKSESSSISLTSFQCDDASRLSSCTTASPILPKRVSSSLSSTSSQSVVTPSSSSSSLRAPDKCNGECSSANNLDDIRSIVTRLVDKVCGNEGSSVVANTIDSDTNAKYISSGAPNGSCSASMTPKNVNLGNSGASASVNSLHCHFCKKEFGYLKRCCGGAAGVKCDVLFHPLCAWFKGAYVSTILTDETFLGKDTGGQFPSGLKFYFYCFNHLPNGMSTQLRARQESLRGQYRIKITDLCRMPGRASSHKWKQDKKDKKKRKSIDSIYSTDDIGSASRDKPTRDCSFDFYRPNMCAACLLPLRNVQTVETIGASSKMLPVQRTEVAMKCSQCKHVVHSACVGHWPSPEDTPNTTIMPQQGNGESNTPKSTPLSNTSENKYSAGPFSYLCDACKSSSASTPGQLHTTPNASASLPLPLPEQSPSSSSFAVSPSQAPRPEVRCVTCRRKGGAFKRAYGQLWQHYFCSAHPVKPITSVSELLSRSNTSSASAVTPSSGSKSSSKPVKLACIYCKQKAGELGKCSHSGCVKMFHPICAAMRANNAYVPRHGFDANGNCLQYCENHVPQGVMKILPPSGPWLDTIQESKWREPYDTALVVLDRIMKREKLKTIFYRSRSDIFDETAAALLHNICNDDKIPVDMSTEDDVDINEYPEDLVPLMEETDVSKKRKGRPAKMSSISRKRAKSLDWDSIDELESSPMNGEFVVFFSGQEMVSKDASRYSDRKTYCDEVSQRILKNIDRHRNEASFFVGHREFLAFERSLSSCLKAYLDTSMADLKSGHFPVMAGDKVLRKEKKRGRPSLDEADDASSKPSTRTLPSAAHEPHSVDIVQSVLEDYCGTEKSDASQSASTLKRTRLKTAHSVVDFGHVLSQQLCPSADLPVPRLNPLDVGLWSISSNPKSLLSIEQVISTVISTLQSCEVPAVVDQELNKGGSKSVNLGEKFVSLLQCRVEKRLSIMDWSGWDGEFSVDSQDSSVIMKAPPVATRKTTTRKFSTRKTSSKKQAVECDRVLAEDFETIPYDVIPDYDRLVTEPLSFAILKQRLQSHKYSSLYGFVKDFYQMLNNGRAITDSDSKTWFDSFVLAKMFQYFIGLWENGQFDLVSPPPPVTVVYEVSSSEDELTDRSLIEAANVNGDGCTKECPVCTKQYILSGFPAAFSNPTKKMSRRKSKQQPCQQASWEWLCPRCVSAVSHDLCGYEVRVWWEGDDTFYQGTILDFDEPSGKHRVHYQDREWEFLELKGEGYLIFLGDHLNSLVKAVERNAATDSKANSRK